MIQRKEHKYFIDYLRILACFMVILIHVNAPNFLARTAVPIFFIITGYLFMEKIDIQVAGKRRFLVKRTERLILPYFSCSLLAIISEIVFVRFAPNLKNSVSSDSPFSLAGLWNIFFVKGASGQLYFLLSLYFVYLFILPFCQVFKDKKTCLFLFLFYVFLNPYLRLVYTQVPILGNTIALNSLDVGLKFFLFGTVIHQFEAQIKRIFKERHIQIAVAILLFVYCLNFINALSEPLLFLTIVAFLSLAYFLERYKSSTVKSISNLTFGIYLFHLPYFVKLSEIIFNKFKIPNHLLFLYVQAVIVFILTASLVILMKRNKLVRIIFLGEV